jgi:hypothetical protein
LANLPDNSVYRKRKGIFANQSDKGTSPTNQKSKDRQPNKQRNTINNLVKELSLGSNTSGSVKDRIDNAIEDGTLANNQR